MTRMARGWWEQPRTAEVSWMGTGSHSSCRPPRASRDGPDLAGLWTSAAGPREPPPNSEEGVRHRQRPGEAAHSASLFSRLRRDEPFRRGGARYLQSEDSAQSDHLQNLMNTDIRKTVYVKNHVKI